ncbi:MAG: hypothetical protein A2745_02095 [Candidatus Harrisonbacteria bacterium RIFCSPHIGHO2_01_FULL_44_13]|uniref:Probable peptidoglycan glycosyltransferase FtsW n=1 Tax=Candidatus Harrisonbacteria bacterium RIFCSPLOWO2_01_FULL_44_18 TaxID=1798407 RepID=A0A1G1ZQK6_9BACT|nr:MAG: hypothetical protein A2745_02095 [Candidatus Harrisonbacteria bacterium RIFCSPHIGHO2_01_FULL_44_13]OGY66030.1 MAG: hypothetical protein A3A16_01340 [Candidatus Harrisonbacteria bacterium RIFCSPLOWO2_01_FULL_44_18]
MGLKPTHRPDYLIIFCVFSLVIFGLIMLASASSHLGKTRFDDSYYYLRHQIIFGLSFGIAGFLAAYKICYRYYEKIAIFLLILGVVSLILVFTPLGFNAGGADRWLKIWPLTFQPSEILKIIFIIYLAAWLGNSLERQKKLWQGFVPFLIVLGAVSMLLLKQPATSTAAILIFVALIVYFVSGAKLTYIFGALLLAALGLLLIIYLTPYRWSRILTYISPDTDLQTTGYHINQALIAIGSGGLFGVGYGQSTTKIHYLPEPVGDSIFAVIAEELGFIGAIGLIAVLILLTVKTVLLSRKINDRFGQLLLVGFASLIATQSLVNIGAISGLLPLTGTPLPFISYGGTALAVFMTIGGIIANISKYARW